MSSSVHFKFKSQKEPSRVTFDGTGISVFELKREIISQSRLGDGSDFELSIYNEDTREEYDDDTTIIPRSTSVIARRLPAARPGKGGAARYVSGKMPVNARSAPRNDPSMSRVTPGTGQSVNNNVLELNNAQTEEEKINALFNLQASQWQEQQQEMANATPVPFGRGRGKPVNVPDHPPPPGYLCYRCREKGHWIQACPTNNDPKYDGKYRVKRSTGIPRSLQTKVEKPESLAPDGSTEDSRNTGVMVNADGDFVIAKPDKASWELYQEKAKASAAAAAEAAAVEESKALQAREGVLLDNLTPDDESASKIKVYEADKAEAKKEKEKIPAAPDGTSVPEVAETEPKESSANKEQSPLNQVQETAPTQSRKRSAEDEPTSRSETVNSELGNVPKKQKADDGHSDVPIQANSVQDGAPVATPNFNNQDMPFNGFGPMQGMPMMPFSAPGFGNEAMGFMNPMAMASANGFPSGMGPGWNPMNMPFNPLQAGMFDQSNGAMPNGFPNMFNGDPSMMFPMPQNGFQGPSAGMNNFSNQQRTAFSTPYSREEDSPYFRQPVNPQRHQARNRRVRPSDYREL
ncbi:hypothetical protein E8E15_006651 [Penicillium rubens]|nr:hypothetical protein E8E15_006651 [Penicillium rubens]